MAFARNPALASRSSSNFSLTVARYLAAAAASSPTAGCGRSTHKPTPISSALRALSNWSPAVGHTRTGAGSTDRIKQTPPHGAGHLCACESVLVAQCVYRSSIPAQRTMVACGHSPHGCQYHLSPDTRCFLQPRQHIIGFGRSRLAGLVRALVQDTSPGGASSIEQRADIVYRTAHLRLCYFCPLVCAELLCGGDYHCAGLWVNLASGKPGLERQAVFHIQGCTASTFDVYDLASASRASKEVCSF